MPDTIRGQVRLSKRTEYGLRAVVQLARLGPSQYVQARDLAQAESLPNKFLESILLTLRQGGFLESKVGSGGGYRLTREPKDIIVGELIRRLDDRLSNTDPATSPATHASHGEIGIHLINAKLTAAMDQVLDTMTVEQLLEMISRASGSHEEMWYI